MIPRTDEDTDPSLDCRILDWDSRHFGVRIARVGPGALTPERGGLALAWSATERVRCLYYLCDGDDRASMEVADDLGFEAFDVRLDLDWAVAPDVPAASDAVRPFCEADRPLVMALARSAFTTTRFTTDPSFPPDRVAALYELWVERSLDGPGSTVLVAVDGDPADVVGFVTCDGDGDDPGVGHIGLLAVDPRCLGRGHGRALVRAAQAHLAGQGARLVTTATQERNHAARATFGRCGFLPRARAVWYHRWFPA